jgi:hypothetical protein
MRQTEPDRGILFHDWAPKCFLAFTECLTVVVMGLASVGTAATVFGVRLKALQHSHRCLDYVSQHR